MLKGRCSIQQSQKVGGRMRWLRVRSSGSGDSSCRLGKGERSGMGVVRKMAISQNVAVLTTGWQEQALGPGTSSCLPAQEAMASLNPQFRGRSLHRALGQIWDGVQDPQAQDQIGDGCFFEHGLHRDNLTGLTS
jgi:hypothetical protein